ncbi:MULTISPECIES: hypothetical protein [Comamonas]|uniref:hypothetical protein n=1 Tax=Comamonas TaxID=283 RepID=UPI00103C6E35|nr:MULTISPECIES: hypothetical protein [Comamonas]TFF62664.1 hypothetical protein EIC84_00890 [Comamonas sp. A23]
MPISECALCLQVKDLKRSHAIPDSVFKVIFRKNNGKAISFDTDDISPVAYSTDSWWEHQLCECCERHLNLSYETYSLSAIRGKKGKVVKSELGVSISNVDALKLQLFFSSILWRAGKSKNDAYKKIRIPDDLDETLRSHILAKSRIPLRKLTVRVSRLIDRSKDGAFSMDVLRNFVCTPFVRCTSLDAFVFCFLFEGFFIELSVPGYKFKKMSEFGVINPKNKILMIPYIDVFDIPEIVGALLMGYRKNKEGKVNL